MFASHRNTPAVEQVCLLESVSTKEDTQHGEPGGISVGEACHRIGLGDLGKASGKHGFLVD